MRIPPAQETCTDPSRGIDSCNLSKQPVFNPRKYRRFPALFVTGITRICIQPESRWASLLLARIFSFDGLLPCVADEEDYDEGDA